MKSKLVIIVVYIMMLSLSSSAQKNREEISSLRNEIAALEQLKAAKLSQLENSEARRWNQRYARNEETGLLQMRARQLESRYGTIAADLNRKQEDILLLRNALDESRNKTEDTRNARKDFAIQIRATLSDISGKLESDFPWNLSLRLALYTSLQEKVESSVTALEPIIDRFFRDQFNRIALSATQELTTRAALFGDGIERTVWNLRLGTIMLIDFDKKDNTYQSLLKTGALEGARYAFRANLGPEYPAQIQQLIASVQNGETAQVPLDVLQNGRLGSVTVTQETASVRDRFLSWFKKGGLIMYPLFFVAFLALLIAFERFITLTIRHHRYTVSYRKIIPLIVSQDWNAVSQFCTKGCSGLTRAIMEIIKRREGGREQAEQYVKQILLAEIPSLEKRLSIVSALGSTAPLLGLLGTVSGMITLFRVITDTGTNDARILAGGISEALITTQTGLLIAIPILLIHGYLVERLDDILSHYNETVLEVFNLVFNRKGTPE